MYSVKGVLESENSLQFMHSPKIVSLVAFINGVTDIANSTVRLNSAIPCSEFLIWTITHINI